MPTPAATRPASSWCDRAGKRADFVIWDDYLTADITEPQRPTEISGAIHETAYFQPIRPDCEVHRPHGAKLGRL